MIRVDLLTLEDTLALGERLAGQLKLRDVVLLQGDLGAGKTTLARAIIQALNPAVEEVPSPTFTLVQIYVTPAGPIFHYDLYRLKQADEIFELGWEESLAEGINLVEWPERLGNYVLKHAKKVTLGSDAAGLRWAELEGFEK